MVEAGVRCGQPIAVWAGPADGEGGGQAGQAFDGYPVTACHKEQQLLLLIRLQAVHHLPEPLHSLKGTAMFQLMVNTAAGTNWSYHLTSYLCGAASGGSDCN